MKKIFNICYLFVLLGLIAASAYIAIRDKTIIYLLTAVALLPAVYLTVKDIRRS